MGIRHLFRAVLGSLDGVRVKLNISRSVRRCERLMLRTFLAIFGYFWPFLAVFGRFWPFYWLETLFMGIRNLFGVVLGSLDGV